MNAARQQKAIERDKLLAERAEAIVSGFGINTNHHRILCAIMYWCEGEKSTGSGVRFMNSDPIMIKLFISSLRKGFDIDETKFRALVQLHQYHNETQQIEFWSEITCIPTHQFHRSYIKSNTGTNSREGYPGCLSLRYGDSSLAKLLKMIYSNLSKI